MKGLEGPKGAISSEPNAIVVVSVIWNGKGAELPLYKGGGLRKPGTGSGVRSIRRHRWAGPKGSN